MTQEIVTVEVRDVSLGSIAVAGPRGVVSQAVDVAAELAKIIRDKRLSRAIQGREFVYVEGWTTLGAMLGVTPREVAVEVTADGDYLATVELVRVSDGAIIGRGSALCGTDEPTWANRPRYARRSMAVTRATGKAYRLAFSWVMKLAGYEPTPAEEMPETDLRRQPPLRPRFGRIAFLKMATPIVFYIAAMIGFCTNAEIRGLVGRVRVIFSPQTRRAVFRQPTSIYLVRMVPP
jgi:hypothetical protein